MKQCQRSLMNFLTTQNRVTEAISKGKRFYKEIL